MDGALRIRQAKMINNSLSIKRAWKERAMKPLNKYNPSLLQATEDWTGELAADYREGKDTGMEMERLIDKQ